MFSQSKFKIITCLLFCIITFTIVSFASKTKTSNYINLSKRFDTYTKAFNLAVISLNNTANTFKKSNISVDSLKNEVSKTRLAYKKIEFYLAFYHNDYVNSHINGAPLLGIERTGTLPEITKPEGLQVLDELVYSNDAEKERNQISYLTTKLRNSYGLLYESLKTKNTFNDSEIVAMRLELVRIFTLGLTGFDTPGSLNALQEAETALQAMLGFLEDNQQRNKKYAVEIGLFKEAIIYLKLPVSFNDFDRLIFLKKYLDPLYKELGRLQSKTNNTEALKYTSAWNTESVSIFSNNFLNPYYFTEIKKEENSPEMTALGKQLFYDPVLSNNEKISCASCHNPAKAFTDGAQKSLSNIQGKTVLRNAPTLINAVYADRYFYDLRAFTLEQQAEHVIFNSAEFNTSYSSILKKLNEKEVYKKQFKTLFKKEALTRENLSKALASYVLSLSSFNSPFDKYVRAETSSIDAEIKDGFNLFMGKANCATCHFAPTFSGLVPPFYSESESEILGVLKHPNAQNIKLDLDEGRIANQITSESAWIYEKSFKTTTVRNVELTAPYFHNGAYKTLEEVIDFYNDGGGEGLGLTVKNQTLPPDPLDLSDYEKTALIAFMKSLTDVSSLK
tara:strand:+ start:249 stop:2102 length:1854 start_codon:yes stop_codon:yes gene_type:complete